MTAGVESVRGAAARWRARLHRRGDGYAFCPHDAFWFRPLYTGGACPLCGETVGDGAARPSLLVRADRFWIGMGALALASVGMCVLVLLAYFSR